MAKEVIIIGGGLSGISSAVWALKNGWRPIILEKSPYLGGRVCSLYAKDAKNKIDIGQHVLSANYQETKFLLSTIGSLKKIHFQKWLKINFKLNGKGNLAFRSWLLPSPFNFFLPLILSPAIPWNEKKAIFNWASKKFSVEQLKQITVSEWLNEMGHAPVLRKLIWEPLTIAVLNTRIEEASAYLLYQALNGAFLASHFKSGLGIPRDYLDEIFVNPAMQYMTDMGGSIYLRTEVKQFISSGNIIQTVITNQNQIFESPNIILAVSPNAISKLLANSNGLKKLSSHLNLEHFDYSPIITINLWFRKKIKSRFPVAFIDSPIQWFFKLPTGNHHLFGYTVVISAAHEEVKLSREELLQLVDGELKRFFNRDIFSELGFERYKIIKEKRATILQTPKILDLRPNSKTMFENLFLAGDWINTNLPATIESAVLSGRQAIETLIGN